MTGDKTRDRALAMGIAEACKVLAIAPGAGPEAVRAAYLAAIKAHPPDRDPGGFELVRRAAEALADPEIWIKAKLVDVDPRQPLADRMALLVDHRRFRGSSWWLDRLRTRMHPGADAKPIKR